MNWVMETVTGSGGRKREMVKDEINVPIALSAFRDKQKRGRERECVCVRVFVTNVKTQEFALPDSCTNNG